MKLFTINKCVFVLETKRMMILFLSLCNVDKIWMLYNAPHNVCSLLLLMYRSAFEQTLPVRHRRCHALMTSDTGELEPGAIFMSRTDGRSTNGVCRSRLSPNGPIACESICCDEYLESLDETAEIEELKENGRNAFAYSNRIVQRSKPLELWQTNLVKFNKI